MQSREITISIPKYNKYKNAIVKKMNASVIDVSNEHASVSMCADDLENLLKSDYSASYILGIKRIKTKPLSHQIKGQLAALKELGVVTIEKLPSGEFIFTYPKDENQAIVEKIIWEFHEFKDNSQPNTNGSYTEYVQQKSKNESCCIII